MNIAAYIISFLPSDPATSDTRLAALIHQLNEWISNTSLEIYVLTMNYTDEEASLLPSERVHLIPTEPLPCTFARKRCQEIFYNSHYKWAVMMDDDALLYPHNSSYNFFKEMDSHIEDYRGITAIYPHMPNINGFNYLYKSEPRYATHHIFTPLVLAKGTLMLLRNLKLYGEEPIYNDTEFTVQEDLAFSIALRVKGHRLFTCSNIVLKEINHGASFTVGGTDDQNKKRIADCKVASKRLVEKYPEYLEETTKGVTVDLTKLKGKVVNGLKKEFIPKDGIYDTTLFDWEAIR